MRRIATILGATASAAVAIAAGLGATSAGAGPGATRVDARGELVRYGTTIAAGATARVHAVYPPSGKTIVTLVVDGLPASTAFGAHVHKSACGATDPLASGGHYQHIPGTVSAAEEVWLDLTTDADGHGEATAVVDWTFAKDLDHPEGANSVVLHRDATNATTGVAGPRLACLTVPFTG